MTKYNPEKVIVADVDGVLLDWVSSFDELAYEYGYEKHSDEHYNLDRCFDGDPSEMMRLASLHNESLRMTSLNPLRDAVKYVRRLHEWHGYTIHCVSALKHTHLVQKAREDNLRDLFGSAIDRVILTGDGISDTKANALKEYGISGCYWIEDKPENAYLGYQLGLDTLLMDQPYNRSAHNKEVRRVSNWSEIYDIVVGA